jgi:hypothetical protein
MVKVHKFLAVPSTFNHADDRRGGREMAEAEAATATVSLDDTSQALDRTDWTAHHGTDDHHSHEAQVDSHEAVIRSVARGRRVCTLGGRRDLASADEEAREEASEVCMEPLEARAPTSVADSGHSRARREEIVAQAKASADDSHILERGTGVGLWEDLDGSRSWAIGDHSSPCKAARIHVHGSPSRRTRVP